MKLDPEGVAKAEAAMALANPYSETYAEDRKKADKKLALFIGALICVTAVLTLVFNTVG